MVSVHPDSGDRQEAAPNITLIQPVFNLVFPAPPPPPPPPPARCGLGEWAKDLIPLVIAIIKGFRPF